MTLLAHLSAGRLAAAAALALTAGVSPAEAQPACPTATLADYFSGTIGPCRVADVTFSDFSGSLQGSPAPAVSSVIVTPTTGFEGLARFAGFQFSGPGGIVLGGTATFQSSILDFAANAALGVAGTFERVLLASGTVAVNAPPVPNGVAFAQSLLSVGALTGEGIRALSVNSGAASETCTSATCDVAFGGGEVRVNASAFGMVTSNPGYTLTNTVTATVSDTELRVTYQVSAVPEPGTWAPLGTGLLAIGGVARRQRRTV